MRYVPTHNHTTTSLTSADLPPGLANDKLRRLGEYVYPGWVNILLILWIFLFILAILKGPVPGHPEELRTSAVAGFVLMVLWVGCTTHLHVVADREYIERYGRRGVPRVRHVGGSAA